MNDVRADARYSASLRIDESDEGTIALRNLRDVAIDVSDYLYKSRSVIVRGSDLAALFRDPLVMSISAGIADPRPSTIHPQRVKAGGWLTMSRTSNLTEVVFGPTVSREIVDAGYGRIRVRVPDDTPIGEADPILRSQYSEQVLSVGINRFEPYEAHAALMIDNESGQRAFAVGDFLWASRVQCPLFEGTCTTEIDWRSGDGSWNDLFVTDDVSAIFIDPRGFINFSRGSSVDRFDREGVRAGNGPSFAANARRVMFDRDGNAIVVRVDGTGGRYAPDGRTLATFNLTAAVTDADLAADQCTLYYAAKGLRTYDVCANRPLSVLGVNAATVRVLPDGTIAAGGDTISLISPTGSVLKVFSGAQAMALTSDGKRLLTTGGETVASIDLASGVPNVVVPIYNGTRNGYLLATYGEWTAARGRASYLDGPVINDLFPMAVPAGATITLEGSAFAKDDIVFVNDVPASGVEVIDANTIRFTMPQTSLPRRVVVRDSNQQEGVINDDTILATTPSSHQRLIRRR